MRCIYLPDLLLKSRFFYIDNKGNKNPEIQ
jgi:hypothetical protein